MKKEIEHNEAVLIQLDDDGYFTGNYAYAGSIANAVQVNGVPDDRDLLKMKSYHYDEAQEQLVFDENKYAALLAAQQEEKELQRQEVLTDAKAEKIADSKAALAKYLEEHTINSTCHKGVEKKYSITSEKQAYLGQMILMASMALQSGLNYQPSWNASGEPCEYDWTLQELQQLAGEIEAVVRPLVSYQQNLEVLIDECSTQDELDAINIDYESVGE